VSAPRRVLIGGGARSGKSAFALERARALGERRLFVATGEALDDEMRARIERHRRERGASFATLEEPIDLPGALVRLASDPPDVAVVDCLTMWIANLLMQGVGEQQIDERVGALGRALAAPPCHVVLVSNEVGLGIVPESALARSFRDLVGRAHQRLAPSCDELYLAALGVIVRLRPSPVELVGGPPAGEDAR
jgi:adenosylcobinamide kinase / adenosylcobinamide-phosphate guanylyltransferase